MNIINKTKSGNYIAETHQNTTKSLVHFIFIRPDLIWVC